MFQVLKYIPGDDIETLLRKKDTNLNEIRESNQIEIMINKKVNIECADPSLIQIWQNEEFLYYFKIDSKS